MSTRPLTSEAGRPHDTERQGGCMASQLEGGGTRLERFAIWTRPRADSTWRRFRAWPWWGQWLGWLIGFLILAPVLLWRSTLGGKAKALLTAAFLGVFVIGAFSSSSSSQGPSTPDTPPVQAALAPAIVAPPTQQPAIRTSPPQVAPTVVQKTPKPKATTKKPPPVIKTTKPPSNCDPNYSGYCLTDGIGDWDCAGGSGNGPNYVPVRVRVIGVDVFGLDADNDGYGCDSL
jgi:hypothetical protein